MSTFRIIMDICFIALLLLCADSDRRIHEIPSPFLFGLALLDLLQLGYLLGTRASIWTYLFSLPLFILLFVCWNMGYIGGGDVKLMSLMGLYLGCLQKVLSFSLTAFFLASWYVVRILRNREPAHSRIALAPPLTLGCMTAMATGYLIMIF